MIESSSDLIQRLCLNQLNKKTTKIPFKCGTNDLKRDITIEVAADAFFFVVITFYWSKIQCALGTEYFVSQWHLEYFTNLSNDEISKEFESILFSVLMNKKTTKRLQTTQVSSDWVISMTQFSNDLNRSMPLKQLELMRIFVILPFQTGDFINEKLYKSLLHQKSSNKLKIFENINHVSFRGNFNE